jgi:hypothetical protein
VADIGWNATAAATPGWYCRARTATGTDAHGAQDHSCPPKLGCDCPHPRFCDANDCTQCCRFDVIPDPVDCHDPLAPFPLEPNETPPR